MGLTFSDEISQKYTATVISRINKIEFTQPAYTYLHTVICQGRTVVIIAHRLAAVRHCDRIITIENGKIVEDGTHVSLIEKANGFYANLWQAQAVS